jgi:hypothetical protein
VPRPRASKHGRRNVKRAYRTLLRLYPADYRAMFASEMLRAFDRVAEERG